jgi:hypothetical protein
MPAMTNAITLRGLTKHHGARAAVENLTIDVPSLNHPTHGEKGEPPWPH